MVLPFLWRTFWLLTQGPQPLKLCKLPWHNCICKLNSSEEWKKLPSAVYLVSSLQRGMKSHFPVLLLNLSSQSFRTEHVELNTIIPLRVYICWVSLKPEPEWCWVTFGTCTFVSSLRRFWSSFVPLPTPLESVAWAASPLPGRRGEAG